jgi:hypothetical protein
MEPMSFNEYEENFDRCGLTAVFPRTSFWSALAELKARGWRVTRDQSTQEYGAWIHYCGKCKMKVETTSMLDKPIGKV